MTTRHDSNRRIGDNYREASPSTGWRETAECMHVDSGLGDREVITVKNGEGDVVEQAVVDPASKKDFVGISS